MNPLRHQNHSGVLFLNADYSNKGFLLSEKIKNHSVSNGEWWRSFKEKCDKEVREEIREEK